MLMFFVCRDGISQSCVWEIHEDIPKFQSKLFLFGNEGINMITFFQHLFVT